MAQRLQRRQVIKIILKILPKARRACEKKAISWRTQLEIALEAEESALRCSAMATQLSHGTHSSNPSSLTYDCTDSDIGEHIPLILFV